MINKNFSLLFKANLFLSIIIFLSFLFYNDNYAFLSLVILVFGAISSAIILYMVFYILLVIFSFNQKLVLTLSAFLFVLANGALIIDFFIYKLFHFHLNAMVLNILLSPDAWDSIQMGIMPIVAFIAIILGLIVFELYIIKKLLALNTPYKNSLNKKLNRLMIVPFFLIVISEKFAYGFASLFSKNEIVSKFKVIPLYQPLTFRRVASKYFDFKAEDQAKYSIKTKADLHYPLAPLKLTLQKEKFNIIIVAMDAVKYSILNKKVAPNITSFQKDAMVFNHHYSGGNATRFGIFSLFYGLNSTYWFSFLRSNQKPIFFDVLKKLEYKIDIFSSTNTNWPEFRKTCYVDIQSSIHDNFKGTPWQKDQKNSQAFLKMLKQHPKEKLFFSFIFFDAPHGYSYPKEKNPFHAPSQETNYMGISKKSNELKDTIKRYKNAIYYDDSLFGNLIQTLKKKNLYDNSLIVFTSDHGQEFYEYGNFGHNTSFSDGQTHVPFMVKLPQILQNRHLEKNINHSFTSHQDVVPTLLKLLGVKNHPSTYSNGKNFFSNKFKREYVFSANWNNNAIITKEFTYVFSNLPNKMFFNEIREKKTYKLLNNHPYNSQLILKLIDENKKFLQ